MGWTAYEYYCALPIEFYAACEGYFEKQNDDAKVIRFASFRIAESMVGSKALGSIESFWPMMGEEKEETKPLTKEEMAGIFERHKSKLKING